MKDNIIQFKKKKTEDNISTEEVIDSLYANKKDIKNIIVLYDVEKYVDGGDATLCNWSSMSISDLCYMKEIFNALFDEVFRN